MTVRAATPPQPQAPRLARPPAGLVDGGTLDRLTVRSDAAGAAQTLGHAAALLLTGTAVVLAPTWWLALPAMLVHGVVLVALFAPLHETMHRTVFRQRWANLALAQVAGFVLLIPPVWFRHFHLAHHRHTQDPANDPELVRPKPSTRAGYLVHLSGLPTWRLLGLTLWRLGRDDTAGMAYVPDHARAGIVANARRQLAAYAVVAVAALAAHSWLPLTLWLGPLVLGQPFLRAYLMAEHTGCELVPDLTRNTRTTLTGGLLRRLAWNMPYHAEHHLYPAVPFHRLPELHGIVGASLHHVAPSYRAAHREIRAEF
ncbi:MAG: fatty acid desaturase [Rhodospirillaceae bacterium]|nr:fatty acid desaturase [Rhodospirillaceae bacterium]